MAESSQGVWGRSNKRFFFQEFWPEPLRGIRSSLCDVLPARCRLSSHVGVSRRLRICEPGALGGGLRGRHTFGRFQSVDSPYQCTSDLALSKLSYVRYVPATHFTGPVAASRNALTVPKINKRITGFLRDAFAETQPFQNSPCLKNTKKEKPLEKEFYCFEKRISLCVFSQV